MCIYVCVCVYAPGIQDAANRLVFRIACCLLSAVAIKTEISRFRINAGKLDFASREWPKKKILWNLRCNGILNAHTIFFIYFFVSTNIAICMVCWVGRVCARVPTPKSKFRPKKKEIWSKKKNNQRNDEGVSANQISVKRKVQLCGFQWPLHSRVCHTSHFWIHTHTQQMPVNGNLKITYRLPSFGALHCLSLFFFVLDRTDFFFLSNVLICGQLIFF